MACSRRKGEQQWGCVACQHAQEGCTGRNRQGTGKEQASCPPEGVGDECGGVAPQPRVLQQPRGVRVLACKGADAQRISGEVSLPTGINEPGISQPWQDSQCPSNQPAPHLWSRGAARQAGCLPRWRHWL